MSKLKTSKDVVERAIIAVTRWKSVPEFPPSGSYQWSMIALVEEIEGLRERVKDLQQFHDWAEPQITDLNRGRPALETPERLPAGTEVTLLGGIWPGTPRDGWIVENIDQPRPLRYRIRHPNGSLVDVLPECITQKASEPQMAMLPNDHHPGPRCSCRECQRKYPESEPI